MTKPATKTVWLGTGEIAGRYGLAVETVRLWITRGVTGPDGRLQLRARRIGSRWMVHRRWLKDFMATCDGPNSAPGPQKVEPETKKQKRFKSEQEAVRRRLGG